MNETYADQTRPVLVGIDGTDDGDRALRFAIAEAQRRGTGIRLLHVLHPPFFAVGPTGLFETPSPRDIGAHILKDAVERTRELAPDLYVAGSLLVGGRAATLAEETYGGACLVVGTSQHGVLRYLGGSTSTGVAARSACPVVCVPPSWDKAPVREQIAVGVDEHAGPRPVLEVAFEEAARRRAELVVVHAWQGPQPYDYSGTWIDPTSWIASAQARLGQAVEDVVAQHPDVRVRILARFEGPQVTLPALADECDLLVLGRQQGGVPLVHHLGSIARHAIHVGSCPVMVVPLPVDDES